MTKKKNITLMVWTILLAPCMLVSQNKFLGQYKLTVGLSSYRIELSKNNICFYTYPGDCLGGALPKDTLKWTSTKDTIYLSGSGQKTQISRYLFKKNRLYEIIYTDSIVSNDISNRLSDHYIISLDGFKRTRND